MDLRLYYLRARWYSPVVGRFLTLDPQECQLQDPLGPHKYLYANAGPVNKSDPTGRFTAAATMASPVATPEYLDSGEVW